MSTDYRRSGECLRCGQCCGAEGSPNQDSPWPNNWPDTIRAWSPESLEEAWPHSRLIPLPVQGQEEGVAQVEGVDVPYKWVPGHAVCKPVGDGYSIECPFLGDSEDPLEEPDTMSPDQLAWLKKNKKLRKRPCILVGTQYEYMWERVCQPNPSERMTGEQVVQWFLDHPACTYVYEEE